MPSTHALSPAATALSPLAAAFAAVVDPRSRQGRRFTAAAMLTLALAAMLANHLSPLAIARWGAEQEAARKRAMGFAKGVTPHRSTSRRLFRRPDPALRSAALVGHRAAHAPPDAPRRGAEGVAIDGEAYRGALACAPPARCPACRHSAALGPAGGDDGGQRRRRAL